MSSCLTLNLSSFSEKNQPSIKKVGLIFYSTVTLFAKLRGLSTSNPLCKLA